MLTYNDCKKCLALSILYWFIQTDVLLLAGAQESAALHKVYIEAQFTSDAPARHARNGRSIVCIIVCIHFHRSTADNTALAMLYIHAV